MHHENLIRGQCSTMQLERLQKIVFQSSIVAVAVCGIPGSSRAQSDVAGAVSQGLQAPDFRVQSTLVFVPVFVYVPNGIERVVTKQEQDCVVGDSSAFLK